MVEDLSSNVQNRSEQKIKTQSFCYEWELCLHEREEEGKVEMCHFACYIYAYHFDLKEKHDVSCEPTERGHVALSLMKSGIAKVWFWSFCFDQRKSNDNESTNLQCNWKFAKRANMELEETRG